MRGGGIQTNDVYKHILSIGFELETSDLAKLSLNGENRLINTVSVFHDLSNEDSVRLDEHYYMFPDETLDDGSFVEYLIETQNSNKSFAITNDISSSDIEEYCEEYFGEDIATPKDKLFQVATEKKTYRVNFAGVMKKNKFVFSGVEWVATFYNPKKSKNIILETFVNALKQLLHNLDNLDAQPCNLYVNKVNIDGTEQKRLLFNKPGTDLYYLQLHYGKEMSMDDIEITPQMTFRSNVVHTVSIMKQILLNEGIADFMNDYDDIDKIEILVDELIYRFHLKPRKIRMNAHVRNYLFFILFKVYCYLNIYKKSFKYFKEALVFQSRHSNYEFYKQIMEFMQTKYSKEESVELFIELINQPDLVIYYLYGREQKEKATREVAERSVFFGDPKSSYLSYFQHFEKKQADWFSKKLDSRTSFSDIKNHTVLFEYRNFYGEFTTFANVNNTSLGIFRKFVSSLENVEDLENHEFNSATKRWVRKCKPGFGRNAKFQCRKKTVKNRDSGVAV